MYGGAMRFVREGFTKVVDAGLRRRICAVKQQPGEGKAAGGGKEVASTFGSGIRQRRPSHTAARRGSAGSGP